MNHRPLKTIADALAAALRREVKDVVEIGDLLTEAKDQLDEHGRWLPWLRDNFPFTPRTAQKYMAAGAFAGKYELGSHLRLSVSGLYALVEVDRNGNSPAVEAALAEAKTKWVDDDRVRVIIAELATRNVDGGAEPLPPQEDDDQPEPPPSLTPRAAAQLRQFDDAAKALLALKAKPAREFLAAAISDFDLVTIANFLQLVAEKKSEAAVKDRVDAT
jgi:hypothetical protein